MDPSTLTLADATIAAVRRELEASSADCGMGTVTALAPGGLAGTVAVDLGSGTPITMRRAAGYSPAVADQVWWLRSRAGDWFVVGKLA
jgi:hypothetical protein